MKICPECLKTFNDDCHICSNCGNGLVDEKVYVPELTDEDIEKGISNSLINQLDNEEDYIFSFELDMKYRGYPFVEPLLNMVFYDKEFREKALSWENLRDRFKNIEIINQRIYEEVKFILDKDSPDTDVDWIKLYSNFVAIVDDLTNHKMTVNEIMQLQDILDDTLRGLNPKIALVVKPEDAGRVLIGLLKVLKIPKAVLTLEEQRWLVCAVIALTYIGKFDEKQGKYILGFYDFSSTKDFSSKYDCGHDSSFFTTFDNPIRYDETKLFGFSKENPILTFNIFTSNVYLSCLVSDNGTINYSRVGSVCGIFGEILDKYKITVTKKSFFGTKEEVKYLYFNPYATKNSYKAPDGFHFKK